jgi:hypothetical protein
MQKNKTAFLPLEKELHKYRCDAYGKLFCSKKREFEFNY